MVLPKWAKNRTEPNLGSTKSASNLESFEILDRICPYMVALYLFVLGLCSCSSVHNAHICTVEYGKVFREYRELHPDIYLHLNLLSAREIFKMWLKLEVALRCLKVKEYNGLQLYHYTEIWKLIRITYCVHDIQKRLYSKQRQKLAYCVTASTRMKKGLPRYRRDDCFPAWGQSQHA